MVASATHGGARHFHRTPGRWALRDVDLAGGALRGAVAAERRRFTRSGRGGPAFANIGPSPRTRFVDPIFAERFGRPTVPTERPRSGQSRETPSAIAPRAPRPRPGRRLPREPGRRGRCGRRRFPRL
jgi:hypothetical protein